MSLWPSRGLELTGVEIKSSRSDWLAELKNPSKAEAVCRYCDHWYVLAAADGIVRDDELPPTWGLMVKARAGVRVVRQAPKLQPTQIPREFLASVLRSAQDAFVRQAKAQTRAELDDERYLELADTGYQVLACPICGDLNAHHSAIEVYDRSEDEEGGLHIRAERGKIAIDRTLTHNPSTRRDGLVIEFWCEGCSGRFVISLAQHKGETQVSWWKFATVEDNNAHP